MMEFIGKLEKIVLGWTKSVPHLPVVAQKWLGTNVWWIALVGAILSAIAVLFALTGLFALMAIVGAPSNAYYVYGGYTGTAILSGVISLIFLAANGLLLALAVNPLKAKQKKGWVLLFLTLLVEALSVVVNAVLSFSVLGFIMAILFGAIALAIGAYFVFEIHSQFGHTPKATIKKA
jgi:uncharacterized membrane protein YhaH (DUF805 family)